MKTIYATLLATIALCAADATGADVQPTNDLPNPYQTTAPCSTAYPTRSN